MVLGFRAILNRPISPAVMTKGIKLGSVLMITIFQLLNKMAIRIQINTMAVIVLSIKLRIVLDSAHQAAMKYTGSTCAGEAASPDSS